VRTLLFFLRLGLYLLVVSLPFLHPAIAVPYDRVGLLFYFVLVPWEILVAFFLAPPRLRPRPWLLAAGLPAALFLLFFSGFELVSLQYLLGAAAAFLLTVLAFADRANTTAAGLGRAVVSFEPFLPAWLAYRLLSFSRASEAVARESTGITQLLLLIIPLAFLLHALILYLAAFRPPQDRRSGRELALYLGVALPLFLVLALLLPADFVRHRIVLNRLDRDLQPKPIPLDERGPAWDRGNLLSDRDGRREGENPREGEKNGEKGRPGQSGRNQLEGIPADQWSEFGSRQGEGNRQYAVMVVASPVQPVYAADAYFGHLDPQAGFLRSTIEEEPLNELAYLRFLETWRDPSPPADRSRQSVEVSYLSTLPERYIAYRPSAIQPTVLRRQYSPFQYSFSAVSRMSTARPRDWSAIEDLSPEETAALRSYLEVPFAEQTRADFAAYLLQALQAHLPRSGGERVGYAARIEAILRSFSSYQYEMGFSDDTSIQAMHRFLFESHRGDCTEFSNTAAILLRLAGVPSRVVTGYLASRELQSFAHLRGLLMLRQAIPELREFPFEELLLVTTAQRHSWVQAYLPAFGWIDLESTAYAIPPPAGQNPSDMNVVIPLIQGQTPEPPPFRFPWRAALRLLAALAVLTTLGLYAYRYVAQAILALRARRDDSRGLAALHTLLLLRLAGRGYELKPFSQTALEYAKRYPELEAFARLHTELRYRESLWVPAQAAARAGTWAALRRSYAEALGRKANIRGGRGLGGGLWALLRRTFSLRGLYYL
jgi:transglutaminase-like putative cysteine protease